MGIMWRLKKGMGYRIDTKCIHGEQGVVGNHSYGAVSLPIYQTATFAHPGIGESTGYDYSRQSNPTRTELEETVSALEGAADTVACSSGMAAIGLCMGLLEQGSHVICTEDLYGGSVRMFRAIGEQRGITFSYVDTSDADQVEQAVRKNTKALYIETPSNPTMKVTDFSQMKEIADRHNLLLIADNTFLTPYFQNDGQRHQNTGCQGGKTAGKCNFSCKMAKITEKSERSVLCRSSGSPGI